MRSVDAHMHLWDLATDPQPWIDPESMAQIHRDFSPADLEEMLDVCGVDVGVVVQATNSAAETRRLLAHPSARIAGVVGWLDLTGDVEAQLADLTAPERSRLVGVRHLVHMDPDPDWLGRPEVGVGLDRLAAHDLGFDLVLRARQLPLAAEAAAAHPATRFVLDHLGGLAEAEDETAWADGLRALARRSNVVAKISGLAGIADDEGRLRRAVELALDAFGPDRLMYGSDWPVAQLGAGAPAWRHAALASLDGLSPAERERILGGTAAEHYRLESM